MQLSASQAVTRSSDRAADIIRHIRAVIADDLPHMLDTMTAILEKDGDVEVVATASNGIGAIRAAQRLTPDLVVLDVEMPVMNGFEAALHIKRRLPDTKILIVSADDEPDLVLAAFACGADAFLSKRDFRAVCAWQLQTMFPESRRASRAPV